MSNSLIDAKAREEALDCRYSFIVQAPAGSGKTELLTQRILVLLAQVSKAPEQVLAITFTKKAAAEMRSRVIQALKFASQEDEPHNNHQKITWNLARKVLKRDQLEHWNILNQPNRLRILTIDGLCSRITRQSPIRSQCGVSSTVTDDAIPYYSSAAESLIRSLETENVWNEQLESLLLHLDNQVERLKSLFVDMLMKRDQWISYLSDENSSILREKLEQGLQEVIRESLHHCMNKIPDDLGTELIILLNFAAENLFLEHRLDSLPENQVEDLQSWQFIAKTLLNSEGQWRKAINKITGFPAPSSLENKDDQLYAKEMKDRMILLLKQLEDYVDFREALFESLALPPSKYSEQQWNIVSALMMVLPVLLAHLQLEFQSKGVVDYIEVQSAALRALGSDDEPSDLALHWDYRIEHLLIDEFQDTSLSQFRLIEKLTRGWEPNDGRTVFLVGDPMQSIYRFREAQVGLFLRARHQGLTHISLKYLELKMNFRSTAGIVDWINNAFEKTFPVQEDIALGAVPYSGSVAAVPKGLRGGDNHVVPHFLINANDEIEAQAIVELINAKLSENTHQNIAILVRSRSHLEKIIPYLQAMGIKFQANEIEKLNHRMVIRDLLSLTKALWNIGDRLAWLSILRAPWCGLVLSDLLCLSKDPDAIIWEQLQNITLIKKLSVDAQKRLSLIVPILNEVLNKIRRLSFHECIKSAWLALGGPACVDDQSDLINAEHYFELVAQCDQGGDIIHFDDLERQVGRLYSTPDPEADNRLQIMSIHKAKGLEFDIVILPGLAKRSALDSAKLLNCLERPRETRSADLILAPIKAAADDHDPIYRYCYHVDAKKAELEAVRLLYVAMTRARSELHLFGVLESDEDGGVVSPAKKTFLGLLWGVLSSSPLPLRDLPPEVGGKDSSVVSNFRINNLSSVPRKFKQLSPPTRGEMSVRTEGGSNYIGTLIHEILYKISIEGLHHYPLEKIPQLIPLWKIRLYELGILENQMQSALQKVEKAITNTLSDEKGRWILSHHPDAKSEYAISTVNNGKIFHYIIDRTFVADGIRWIIDYKSADPKNENIEEFIHAEKEKHKIQLVNYSTALSVLDNNPIQLVLYFPLIKEYSYVKL